MRWCRHLDDQAVAGGGNGPDAIGEGDRRGMHVAVQPYKGGLEHTVPVQPRPRPAALKDAPDSGAVVGGEPGGRHAEFDHFLGGGGDARATKSAIAGPAPSMSIADAAAGGDDSSGDLVAGRGPVDFPARASFFGSAMPWPRVSRHRRRRRVKPR
ncbi:hypothetical protein GCM10010191_22340 [Actinomadura vinacea]|uniref:Uncharacterized protein n=1 Tax=Actinomadura vinacea TaxID=115336 RepID=A0ABN3ITB1_9ACTN